MAGSAGRDAAVDRMNQRGDFWRVARFELRMLVADRTLWLTLALLALLLMYGLCNGIEQTRLRDETAAQTEEQDRAKIARLADSLKRMYAGDFLPDDPFANPVDPSAVGFGIGATHAILPSAPLAPLAFGQSDMQPNEYRITVDSRVNFMQDAEIENPWNLLNGRFDLAFVITFLLPLLVFAISYNVLSAEREQGTLRLLLSQPLTLRTVLLAKLTVRALLLLGVAVVLPLVLLLVFHADARESPAGLLAWPGLVLAYGSFWFALCAAINSLARSSAFNAMTLVGLWVLLVLVLPLLLNLVVNLAHPAPSRIELATQTRIATIRNLNALAERFGREYEHVNRPELLRPKDGKLAVPERMRAFFLEAHTLDADLDALMDRFDAQLERQQSLVDRWGFVSPAVTVHEGLADLSGNGAERYLEFQRQIKEHHDAWKAWFAPRIVEGLAIEPPHLPQMPRWHWQEAGAPHSPLRLIQLAALAGLMFIFTMRRLRRYPVV
jgi:ABC-2 type transport system permease protein